MAFNPSSPVTGGSQTGLTSPTYTLTADVAPDGNGEQYAVSALGGTQTGVTVSSVSSPFTVTIWRPKSFKTLGAVDPNTGRLSSVPKNVWKIIVRKGVTPLSGQPVSILLMSLTIEVPAGADEADPANIRAALSFLVGVLNQVSAGLGDSLITGII